MIKRVCQKPFQCSFNVLQFSDLFLFKTNFSFNVGTNCFVIPLIFFHPPEALFLKDQTPITSPLNLVCYWKTALGRSDSPFIPRIFVDSIGTESLTYRTYIMEEFVLNFATTSSPFILNQQDQIQPEQRSRSIHGENLFAFFIVHELMILLADFSKASVKGQSNYIKPHSM